MVPLFVPFLSALAAAVLLRIAALVIYRKNKLDVAQSELNEKLRAVLKTCRGLDIYIPPFTFVSGFVQTIFNNSPVRNHLKPKQRENIIIPERKKPINATCCPEIIPEGLVSIDWIYPEDRTSSRGIVILVPGLTGSSFEPYISVVSEALTDANFTCAAYNPRSRGGNKLMTPFLYSGGYTEDIRLVVEKIRSSHPESKLFAIGFSLGAGYLGKYIGEEAGKCEFSAAIVAGGPTDLYANSVYLEHSPMGRFLDGFLVSFVQKVRAEIQDIFSKSANYDLEALRKTRTMHRFDHEFTAKMCGYQCASDYYRGAS